MACQSYRTGIISRNTFMTFIIFCVVSLASRRAGSVSESIPEGESVTIFWTAPGDDGRVGRAAVYEAPDPVPAQDAPALSKAAIRVKSQTGQRGNNFRFRRRVGLKDDGNAPP